MFNKKLTVHQLCYLAIFAAIFLVADVFSLRVGNGNINIADIFLFIAVRIMPSPYIALAILVGFSLGDLAASVAIYIPVTLLIRFIELVLFLTLIRFNLDLKLNWKMVILGLVIFAIAQSQMVALYYLYDLLVYDHSLALDNLLTANIIQAGVVAGVTFPIYLVIYNRKLTFFQANNQQEPRA